MEKNEIIKLKVYMNVLGVCRKTAGKMRQRDRKKLKLKSDEPLLMSQFKKMYSVDVLEKELVLQRKVV